MTEEQKQKKKPRQNRSPAFPFISLEKALVRAEKLMEAEGDNVVPLSSAFTAWGYGEKSSNGRQTIAALRQFALMEYEKDNTNGVFLTKHAWNILKDIRPDSTEKKDLIKLSALEPKIHRELWEKYGANLPSDNTILTYLVKDRIFSDSGAKDLLDEYKATISFAKLGQPDNIPLSNSEYTDEKPSSEEQEDKNIQEQGGGVGILISSEEQSIQTKTERLIDDEGREIIFQFSGNPLNAYQYLKDYLDFKMKRMEKKRIEEEPVMGGNQEGEIPIEE